MGLVFKLLEELVISLVADIPDAAGFQLQALQQEGSPRRKPAGAA